jgi:hypothetical protein
MFIAELFEPTPDGYRNEKEDNSVQKLSDVRKTRLSLSQINRLRIMNDIRKYEHEQKMNSISKQYKPAEAAAAPGI